MASTSRRRFVAVAGTNLAAGAASTALLAACGPASGQAPEV